MAEWVAYSKLEPFGESRADLRAGTIAAPLINLWKSDDGFRADPNDWIGKFGLEAENAEGEDQDPEEIARMLARVAGVNYEPR